MKQTVAEKKIPTLIEKRSGETHPFQAEKIALAMGKAFRATQGAWSDEIRDRLLEAVLMHLAESTSTSSVRVETVQDIVEQTLMEQGYYTQAKSYILYREQRRRKRAERNELAALFPELKDLRDVLVSIEVDYPEEKYDLALLLRKFHAFYKADVPLAERVDLLLKAATELIDETATRWEHIAGRLSACYLRHRVEIATVHMGAQNLYDKIHKLTELGFYAPSVLEAYSKEEIAEAAAFMEPERDHLLTNAGVEMLTSRYLIYNHSHEPLEHLQEMYLGIALFLGMKEEKSTRMEWVRRFYDMLSTLQVTMATPTLANARKPFHQLSSCFIDTVPDSLTGIYRSISNFAEISKYGGGMGLYFGKVRANGSDIRGFEGAAGGVIRWIKLANDTAVAVDQLGVRQGAVAVYLDVWHRDLPEFLDLRTNNGDDRMKAHDVFPAVCYPDYFWEQVENNPDGNWHLMCPHEIKKAMGYSLEDSFGDEWKERYLACIEEPKIRKRIIPIKDIVRMTIRSLVETGTPFAFNRDTVNLANPNSHKGVIYCSNLCTEIAQNMSAIEDVDQTIQTVDGETVVVTRTKPGDFVVCNLASLNLGRIDVDNPQELEHVTTSVVRALDNVIDLNYFPVPYAKINNGLYRPIGLGVSGNHHLLALKGIAWESEEHLEFADRVFEDINYYTIRASVQNAADKGSYEYYPGSEWETGAYFEKRGYTSERWTKLREEMKEVGIRNGYLLAVAPTASTSIIAGTTAGIDPIQSRFYYDEKKKGLVARVAPDLDESNYWLYKDAHLIDQHFSVRACGVRQRHIDQAQSMNLYITNDYTFREILNLYLTAWKEGVKTVYYVRSRSLEVEECVSCAL